MLGGLGPGERVLNKVLSGEAPPPPESSTPSPFYVPFLTEKVALSYAFDWQMIPLSYP